VIVWPEPALSKVEAMVDTPAAHLNPLHPGLTQTVDAKWRTKSRQPVLSVQQIAASRGREQIARLLARAALELLDKQQVTIESSVYVNFGATSPLFLFEYLLR